MFLPFHLFSLPTAINRPSRNECLRKKAYFCGKFCIYDSSDLMFRPLKTGSSGYFCTQRAILFLALSILLPTLMIAAGTRRNFTLVIDPGHGGKDAGAVGAITNEKTINLNIALAFGRLVEAGCPDVRVLYTRKTDTFVTLQGRADLANRNKADLFVSIHTNAVQVGKATTHGVETYTLGMHRAAENLAVAKRENSVITQEANYRRTYQNFDPNKSESYIIFEVLQDHNMQQSVDFARAVQQKYAARGRKNKGVHQAGFLVLRATSMPSVLTEVGFITHPQEERFLASKEGVQAIARSLYDGFRNYRRRYAGINEPPADPADYAYVHPEDAPTEPEVTLAETTLAEIPASAPATTESAAEAFALRQAEGTQRGDALMPPTDTPTDPDTLAAATLSAGQRALARRRAQKTVQTINVAETESETATADPRTSGLALLAQVVPVETRPFGKTTSEPATKQEQVSPKAEAPVKKTEQPPKTPKPSSPEKAEKTAPMKDPKKAVPAPNPEKSVPAAGGQPVKAAPTAVKEEKPAVKASPKTTKPEVPAPTKAAKTAVTTEKPVVKAEMPTPAKTEQKPAKAEKTPPPAGDTLPSKGTRPVSATTVKKTDQEIAAEQRAEIERRSDPQTAAAKTGKPAAEKASGGKIVFKVQILASAHKLAANDPQFKGLSPVDFYQDNGSYKYTHGQCADPTAARRLRTAIADRFPQAFIVAFEDGKRIDTQKAIQQLKATPKKP